MTSLEDNMGINFDELGLGGSFLNTTPKAQTTKEKLNNLDFHQNLKLLCFKDTIVKIKKKKHMEWERIFANHTSYSNFYLE